MATLNEIHEEILQAAQDAETFIQLVLSQNADREGVPWTKVTVRPVALRGERHLQVSSWDGRQVVHSNYAGDEATAHLREILAWPFRQLHMQTTQGDLHVRISKKGKVLVSRSQPSREVSAPSLRHDRVKDRPLQTTSSHSFLEAVGITDSRGKVRSGMGSKFRQVNEFLRVIAQVVEGVPDDRPLHVVDCGCGRAYLTFAAYHYLNEVRGLTARVEGVDINAELLETMRPIRDELGYERLRFHVATIAEFQPKTIPDLVLSLHACDDATDEALAQGVRWASRWILAAPCCQHELYDQLDDALFRPVLRHGILRQRLADILTDALRALILRILGYSTQAIEFVSPEHTSKNLMIVAEKRLPPGDAQMAREYQALKAYWRVTPVLEKMLADELAPLLPTYA
jgi:SAM-dependent methyltransferase